MNTLIPVYVLTGFLGSGKTTVIKKLLADESFGNTALLINEFGEAGVDNHLLGDIDQEIVLLARGCLCCSIRGDLSDALLDLASKREAGTVPHFSRVIIETTGLADPGPIAATIANDSRVRNQFLLGSVLTVVDLQNALKTLDEIEVWTDQVAAADAIWFSKRDLTVPEIADQVFKETQRVNPSAKVIEHADAISLNDLFQTRQLSTDFFSPPPVRKTQASQVPLRPDYAGPAERQKLDGISSFRLDFDQSIDWVIFGVWLSLVLHRHGKKFLRVKGLLKLKGVKQPVVIHGVQHTLFPPEHVDFKNMHEISPYLIFIVRNISEQIIRSSLKMFLEDFPRRLKD
jgi:G3E family GTPase